jgi:hypothetical protein
VQLERFYWQLTEKSVAHNASKLMLKRMEKHAITSSAIYAKTVIAK